MISFFQALYQIVYAALERRRRFHPDRTGSASAPCSGCCWPSSRRPSAFRSSKRGRPNEAPLCARWRRPPRPRSITDLRNESGGAPRSIPSDVDATTFSVSTRSPSHARHHAGKRWFAKLTRSSGTCPRPVWRRRPPCSREWPRSSLMPIATIAFVSSDRPTRPGNSVSAAVADGSPGAIGAARVAQPGQTRRTRRILRSSMTRGTRIGPTPASALPRPGPPA